MNDRRHAVVAPGATSARSGTDFRLLYRKLGDALAQIERISDVTQLLEVSLEILLARFESELGFEGGRIYRREGDEYVLCCGFGISRGAPLGLRVPRNYPPHLQTLAEGLVIMSRGEAGIDEEFEDAIGVSSTFAAIAVGEGNSHVIAFSIRGEVREEQLLYSLTAVRHAINLKLQQLRATGIIEEARIVQESILPALPPAFEGFDIDGRSRPAETVGGDLFDYLPLPDGRLGLAIADSSGHGLPAALLARDAVTGLRMGIGEQPPVVGVIERLNRVIHRSALSSKFVSLFYGELSADGTLHYCNAGHNPPLWRRGETFVELDRGGTVLGPIPSARYESARVTLGSGDTVVMYTDGVVEREDRDGDPFGEARLRALVLELKGTGARESVEAILAGVEKHGGGAPARDDMTVLVARRV